jgi:hypothetical protein
MKTLLACAAGCAVVAFVAVVGGHRRSKPFTRRVGATAYGTLVKIALGAKRKM